MHHLGVLAFGSLITCPGAELEEATGRRIPNVLTPFHVEFARSSQDRGGAPTLVRVAAGGANVKGTIFVMRDWISLLEARNLLYRRETKQVGSGRAYEHRKKPGSNQVHLPGLSEFASITSVIYTVLGETIGRDERTGDRLADLAIGSVKRAEPERDGITYLARALEQGILTPLSREYEAAILRKTEAATLMEALKAVKRRRD